jgi:hypothetical protein
VEEEEKEEDGEKELKEEQSTSKSLLECVKDNDVANLTRQVSAFSCGVRRSQLVSAPSCQCCGSGSWIRCLFDPWIRDPGY